VVGTDDLVEGKMAAAVVPAGETDVVGVIPVGDFDEAPRRRRMVVYRKR
jgi:hypothetical protein